MKQKLKRLKTGKISSDPSLVLSAWHNHSSSHESDFPILKPYNVENLSFDNEKMILDVPFSLDEVEGAVRRLKSGKAGVCKVDVCGWQVPT